MKLHHHGHHSGHHHRGSHHGHHKGHHHHKGKHKKGLGGKALVRDMLAHGGGSISQADRDFQQLVDKVASALLGGGFAAEIIAAIEAVVGAQMERAPGRLIAGTISTNAGALQGAAGGDTNLAMVYPNGSTSAVPCYVPPHLWADLSPGQEVWIHAANGQRQDLAVHSVRNFTTAPASSGYETSAHASSTYETQAHASSTYETQAAVAGHLFYFLASPFNVANAQAITFGNSATWTVAGGSTGVPSNATAVLLYISYSSASTGGYLSVNQGSTSNSTSPYLQAGDIMNAANAHKAHFIMPLGGNTTITGRASGAGNGTVNTIMILGYVA